MKKKPGHITRRDFLNGVLIGSGAALASGIVRPPFAHAQSGPTWNSPEALRGGNVPSVISVGHWLRANRVAVSGSTATIAPSPRDTIAGSFPIEEDPERWDAVIVGTGITALSAAWFLRREVPDAKILMVDINGYPGGVASRDDVSPIPMPSATGGAYCVAPYADFLSDFYRGVGIQWHDHVVRDPLYCYWFDEHSPYANPGTRGWNRDTYGRGMPELPYSPQIVADLLASRERLIAWYNTTGGPTDPADDTDPQFDWLSQMSFADYCASQGWHPAVADFYTRYAIDALAGPTQFSNALTSISFIAAEFHDIWAPPGGTSGVARHAIKNLIPGAIAGNQRAEILANPMNLAALDDHDSEVRIRLNALAVHADTGPSGGSVVYYQNGRFVRATGKSVILAGQGYTSHKLVAHLASPAVMAAWDELTLIPVIVANVTLREARPLVELGLGYDQYWWGSEHWADFVISDWTSASRREREDPSRPVVLTFYGQNLRPPEEMAAERGLLLSTPFSAYEDSLRADLNRMLAPASFDFDRDVDAVYLYRWGHGMVYPKVGYVFGPPTAAGRTLAPRHLARQAIGRIKFGAQDTEGSPAIESAIGAGLRTATEALEHLD